MKKKERESEWALCFPTLLIITPSILKFVYQVFPAFLATELIEYELHYEWVINAVWYEICIFRVGAMKNDLLP